MLPATANGQITVNFFPAIYGQSLDGLVYAQIINSSRMDLKVVETITIREMSGINVSTVKTAPFILFQGSNLISKTAFTNGRFSFSNSYYGTMLGQTGRLPEGEYEY